MTTIAWDGKSLAADSQVNFRGGIELAPVEKIWLMSQSVCTLECQQVVAAGGSGDLDGVMCFRRWLNTADAVLWKNFPKTCEKAIEEGNLDIFAVLEGGHLLHFGPSGFPTTMASEIQAFGSGSAYAMGAMLAGATAREAVTIACRLDPDSGGVVRHLSDLIEKKITVVGGMP